MKGERLEVAEQRKAIFDDLWNDGITAFVRPVMINLCAAFGTGNFSREDITETCKMHGILDYSVIRTLRSNQLFACEGYDVETGAYGYSLCSDFVEFIKGKARTGNVLKK